jgi:membrane-associated phospholipid phosphatase
MKRLLIVSLVLLAAFQSKSQDTPVHLNPNPDTDITGKGNASGEVYKIKAKVDIPITLAAAGFTLFGFSKIYSRDKIPESEILALRPENVNSIDRSTAGNFDEKAKDLSDKFFFGAMPAPLILMLDKEIRKDGLKVGMLYLEAMTITGVFYTGSSMIVGRFRPRTYNTTLPMEDRTRGAGKNSFIAGHPALVATSTFFMAKVYSDYHPEMKNKWILYTLAGGASLATGLLRIKAGEHFPTDVMAGIPVGVLSGILVPHFHKIKAFKNNGLTLMPYHNQGANGFTALLRIK